jgi:nucleotide-binding universal stress UspA family protein
MAKVKITYKPGVVRDLHRSPRMLAELTARANRIAQAADTAANDPGGHEVLTEIGPGRARAAVLTRTPKSMWKEATLHTLTSSLGAGRG